MGGERGADQRQVNDPAAQPLQQGIGVAFIQSKIHTGVHLAEGGDPPLNRQLADAAYQAQAQGSARGVPAVGHRLHHALRHGQQGGTPLIEHLAFRRQLQGTAVPAEQFAAQLLLQKLHLLAHRGLGHAQLVGGHVDAALVHNFKEIADLL